MILTVFLQLTTLKKEGGNASLSSEKVLAFRQALHILDTGLTVDGPLKRQLGALEMRDQRAVSIS